ncbi:uncharacterized protein, partial [Penaeus vannamei]|uniref:uncharacterized protein n=1 Tax=Penaeus vannamei TaxID=6689 RepID=UPI00387F455C
MLVLMPRRMLASDDGKDSSEGGGDGELLSPLTDAFSLRRGRRRQRLFKLKFHHQALPPEYLDHYEASLRQEQRAAAAASANSSPACTPTTARHPREALGPEAAPARDAPEGGLQGGVPRPGRGGRGRGRAQRNSRPITIHEAGAGATEALLRDLLTRPHLQQAALQHVALARAQSVPSIMLASQQGARSPPSPGAAAQEEQLPYMGEMLLDARPRRGRKPKKADITHLISKNYGLHGAGLGVAGAMHEQVAMQHPDYSLHHLQQQLEQQQQQQEEAARRYSPMEQESLARSRSYSLLQSALAAAEAQDQSEPLNLCVRDRPFKREPEAARAQGDLPRIKLEPPSVIEEEEASRGGEVASPDGVAWAAGGRLGVPAHWLHDYRLKTEDGLSSGQSTPSLCSQSSHLPSLSPPAFPHMSPPPPLASPRMRLSPHLMACPQSPHSPSPVPPASPLPPGHHHRHVHALLKESLQQRLEEAARERLSPQ